VEQQRQALPHQQPSGGLLLVAGGLRAAETGGGQAPLELVVDAHAGAGSMTTSASPARTGCPGSTFTSATVPATPQVRTDSIFIASTAQTPCPASTVSPTATSTRTTVPCIWLVTVPDPDATPPAMLSRLRAGGRVSRPGRGIEYHRRPTRTCCDRPPAATPAPSPSTTAPSTP